MTSGYVAMKKRFLGGGHLGFFITVINVTAKWATDLESHSVKLNIEFVFIIVIL